VKNLILPATEPANKLVYLRCRALYCVSHMLPLFTASPAGAKQHAPFISFLLAALVKAVAPAEPLPVRSVNAPQPVPFPPYRPLPSPPRASALER
jgi:hypothetical protein